VGLGITVALRVLPIPAGTDQPAPARADFVREARRAVWLSHPNLPRIHDFFCVQDAGVLVTDYVEGETLAERVSRLRHLPLADVVRYAQELCDVLGYLHTQDPPIFWCDITPSDVVIAADGHLWLEALGVGRQHAHCSVYGAPTPGCSDHMASEWQSANVLLAKQADLGTLGNLLHVLSDGDAYSSSQPASGIQPHEAPGALAAWRRLIRRALADDPADCFACAEEFRAALDDVARALPAEVPFARAPSVPPRLARASGRTAMDWAACEVLRPRRRAVTSLAHVTSDASIDTPAERSLADQPTTTQEQTVAHRTIQRHRWHWTLRALGVAGAAVVALAGVVAAASLGLATGASPSSTTLSGILRSSGDGLAGTPETHMLGGLLGSPPPPTAPAVTAPKHVVEPAHIARSPATPGQNAATSTSTTSRRIATNRPVPAAAQSASHPKGARAQLPPPAASPEPLPSAAVLLSTLPPSRAPHSGDTPPPGHVPCAGPTQDVVVGPVEATAPSSTSDPDDETDQQSDTSTPASGDSVGRAPGDAPGPGFIPCRSPGGALSTRTHEGNDAANELPVSDSHVPPATGQVNSSAHHSHHSKRPDEGKQVPASDTSATSTASC
jgi:hypothetical protein